jgi:hypothetical protein
MVQDLDSGTFLAAAFQTGDGSFLPVKVAAVDAPFANVLLSPQTTWQGRPRNVEYGDIVSRMREETDVSEQTTLISRMLYAFPRSTTLDRAHVAMRANPFLHLLDFPKRLSRRELKILTGVVSGDENCVFTFPDPPTRTSLTHVIAISMGPKDLLCALNLEGHTVRPIPLCNVVDVSK